MSITRRTFGRMSGGAAMALAARHAWGAVAPSASSSLFYFAVVTDTHIIDDFYRGPEGSAEDTASIFRTTERLVAARTFLNSLRPKMELVFVPGDCFHNYPSADYDFYFQNRTRIDVAKELFDGFAMPVHLGFGNHDYDEHRKPGVPREMSNRLFAAKLKTRPYYAVDYKGFRFLHLNVFLGASWDDASSGHDRQTGTFGEEQLNWAEAQLAEGRPTVVFMHYPLWLVAPVELKDYGMHPLLRKHQETVQMVIAGHWHKWVDFAHTFGPQHYVAAATRYDPNAYMLFSADNRSSKVRWLNAGLVEWGTHYSKPFSEQAYIESLRGVSAS